MSRSLGLALGFAADRAFGDPRRFHPVAGFGRAATRLETRLYDDTRAAGVVYAGLLAGSATAAGLVTERLVRDRPVAHTLVTAVTTWAVLGARSLEREAAAMESLLVAGDVPGARDRLGHLCSRNRVGLGPGDLARATVESVAENTSDACVAPLLWGGLHGLPGLLGYRAVNTLDAMVGYRSARYRNFGWAAARLDDLANYLPARACALLTGLVAGRPGAAWRTWRRDAPGHPSPNAGPVEAAFAGALDLRLGGRNTYGDEVEDRGVLGDGRAPELADIRRTAQLARQVGRATLVVALVVAVPASRSGRTGRPGHRRRWRQR